MPHVVYIVCLAFNYINNNIIITRYLCKSSPIIQLFFSVKMYLSVNKNRINE